MNLWVMSRDEYLYPDPEVFSPGEVLGALTYQRQGVQSLELHFRDWKKVPIDNH